MRALTVGSRLEVSSCAFIRRTLAQGAPTKGNGRVAPAVSVLRAMGRRSELVAETDLQRPARLRRAVLHAEGFVGHEVVDVLAVLVHAAVVDDAAHVAA